jgi:hypothetical protein
VESAETGQALRYLAVTGRGKMYYEKLALEVGATVAGLKVIKPALITGESGVVQKFTFVAGDGSEMYAFDLYPKISEVELLRTYVKKMDTGAKTYVVSLSGRAETEMARMAENFGIEILGPSEVGDFFSNRIAEQLKASRGTRAALV